MSAIQNEFSWSFSRHVVFQTCLKRYYFTYYAAWGGWNAEAPPAARETYILKKLYTRFQWAGHHAHLLLAELIKQREQITPETTEQLLEQHLEGMRREFRASRERRYRSDPVHIPGLFEHEYDLAVPPDEWKAVVSRVEAAVRNFLQSDLWQQVKGLPDDAILGIEKRASFVLDGLTVFAIPDLAFRREAEVDIYDWKTGDIQPADARLQLGIYTLLSMDRWTADPDAIHPVALNPITGQTEAIQFNQAETDDLKEFIRDSAEEMLFPLEEPERNIAGNGDEFDCAADDESCRNCVFLRICPKWR